MLLLPPQHGKSHIASRRYPAFTLGRDPRHDIISASATSTLAEEFGRDVRNLLATREYRALFSTTLAEDSQAAGHWKTQEGGSYYAVGIGGALMGRGATRLIIDDPFATMADAQSENARDRVWDWYVGTAYNRVRPKGAIVLIQHRMHEDDLAGRLIERQKAGGDTWEIVLLPAIQDGQIPDAEVIAGILHDVQMGESELRQELADLKNPAQFHVPGELEAYLELKHSLTETIPKLNQLENHLTHVLHILER